MSENKMGNRGSKSRNHLVKEQRVDGSYLHEVECSQIRPSTSLRVVTSWGLRCTLMDFERSYQVRIPSRCFFEVFSPNISLRAGVKGKSFATGTAASDRSCSNQIIKSFSISKKKLYKFFSTSLFPPGGGNYFVALKISK